VAKSLLYSLYWLLPRETVSFNILALSGTPAVGWLRAKDVALAGAQEARAQPRRRASPLRLAQALFIFMSLLSRSFFLERNMLSFFLKIMNQRCGSYVCVQLLQTLNILFENIRNETSICE